MHATSHPLDARSRSRLPALAWALFLTLGSNAQAVTIPAVPLESGAAYPPPNVMFILDDSTSMGVDFMPSENVGACDVESINKPVSMTSAQRREISCAAYTANTLHYNPNTTYLPWRNSDGTYQAARPYTSAWDDDYLSTTAVNLTGSTRTYYAPKGSTGLDDKANYWRYQIRNTVDGFRTVRSEWANARALPAPTQTTVEAKTSTPINQTLPTTARNTWTNGTTGVTAPTTYSFSFSNSATINYTSMVVTISGTDPDANLYLRRGNAPTTTTFDCRPNIANSSNETCTIPSPNTGTWYVGVRAADTSTGNFANNSVRLTVTLYYDETITTTLPHPDIALGCATTLSGLDWRNCEVQTPTGRDHAAEMQNYANWYSFHRTRMKAAKAGASEAFATLPENLRIGFTNIHGDTGSKLDIPVGTDSGLFRGANKANWFAKLQAETVAGTAYTPLRTGLAAVGEYYKNTSATGPWGPGTGTSQLACRQNFAILTTDGYWNKQDEGGKTRPTGNQDGTAGPNGYSDIAPYADNFSDTLADVSMFYWKNDLRTDMTNNVPRSSEDPATWQHMSTFSISIGLRGELASLPTTRAGWKNPDPGSGTGILQGIDDLWHAAVNGRGKFIVANDSSTFQRGLLDAFSVVAQRTGSASNVTANSTSFTTDTQVFQASYVSGSWTGELAAYAASALGVAATPTWRASAQIPAAASRNLFTYNSGTNAGATFPTTAQQTALDASSRVSSPVSAADNVAYLKGVDTLERKNANGTLRTRDSRMGDIVNSSPYYVKDTNTIYVGANDGMLHAFSNTGAELFAYVPAGINFTNLASLSDPYYIHKYFVDGPVVVSTREQTANKNYLVGSLGRGGNGLFGLDVTTPATFGASNVKWELQHADLGQVLGEPLIVTLNDVNKTPAVVVGNGINSANGKAVLFVVNIATGAVIQRLDTGVGSDNALFAPRGWDNDGNGTVDYVYAGDRKGNVWKFDFSGTTASIANGGNAMFKTNSNQPITTGVALARDPATNKRWLFVGTGSYMTSTDSSDTSVQSIYGVIDEGSTTIQRSDLKERDILVVAEIDTDTNNDGVADGKRAVRGFEPTGTLPAGKKGWFIDLDTPTPGERVTSRPQIKGTVLVFASRIPPANLLAEACDAGGSGYINAVDPFTGVSTGNPYLDGNADGSVDDDDRITHNGNTVPIGSIDLHIGMPTLPTVIDKLLIVGGSTGNLGSVVINPQGGSPRRSSWREVEGD